MEERIRIFMGNLLKLQDTIHYTFTKQELLFQALTHSSYANEQKNAKVVCNERLEFLGDAVLELVVSEVIFDDNSQMSEGEMTKLRASLVCEVSLAECARKMNLGAFLLLGKGEAATGGRERNSLLSDAVEALIGSIYLDGGYQKAKQFILHHILSKRKEKELFLDSKTLLQELVQSEHKRKLQYELVKAEGPDHNKHFVVQVKVNGVSLGMGSGKTKKAAEQEAAYYSILMLKERV